VEEKIDIRRPVAVVLHHGWRIAALGAIAAVVTYVVGLVAPQTYTAAALVGIIDRSNVVAFDPRFLPIERDIPIFEPYPALASSEAVLSDLLLHLDDRAPGDGSLEALRAQLSAALSGDKVLLRLTASADTPEEAASLANAWAEVVVNHASALYEATDVALLARYEEQLALARGDVQAARDALAQHDLAVNERASASELAAAQAEVERLQEEMLALRAIQRDVGAIGAALEADEDLSLGPSLSDLLAETLRPMAENASLPDAAADASPDALFDVVERILAERTEATQNALKSAQVRSAELGEERAEEGAERDELVFVLREAEDRVLLLAEEAERVRMAAEDSRIKVQLSSRAGVPAKPSSGGTSVRATVLGGLTGILLGVVLALFLEGGREARVGSPSAEA
jgi:capsular polysaccharide biosynthesis protein